MVLSCMDFSSQFVWNLPSLLDQLYRPSSHVAPCYSSRGFYALFQRKKTAFLMLSPSGLLSYNILCNSVPSEQVHKEFFVMNLFAQNN